MKRIISLVLCLIIVISCINVIQNWPVSADSSTKILVKELEGYTRVSLSDFKTSAGNFLSVASTLEGTAVSSTASTRFYMTTGVEGSDSFVLDKTYLDFDINLAESTNKPSIMLYESADWHDYLRLQFNNTNSTISFAYISSYTGSTITRFNKSFNLIDFGRTSATEFFNVKIRTDFAANSADPTKRDAVFQVWINNMFAFEESLTGENMRNGLFIRPGGETIYLRESKYLETELDGYRRVNMFDYDKTVGSDGVISMAVGEHIDSYITDFDKTYLDVDLLYGDSNTGQFQYQGYAKYLACFYMTFNTTETFRLGAYKDYSNNKLTETLVTVNASDYGISKSDYFNIKLRTDIVNNGSSDSVSVQLWIENKLAYEGTVSFNYGESDHTRGQIWTTKAMSIRSAADINSNISGYNRIVLDDFENLEGTNSETGRDFPSAKFGEYTGEATDLYNSYLDVDIKTTNNMDPFLIWLSKSKTKETFYGDGYQLRFFLATTGGVTTLKMMKVVAGANAGKVEIGDITASPYNYNPDEFFNLKIKTTVYGANSIGLMVFVNNIFLNNIHLDNYDAETIADMTCAGIRGDINKTGVTYARTPAENTQVIESLPEFDSEKHIKTISGLETVLTGQLNTYDYHIEDNDLYVVTQYTVSNSDNSGSGFETIVSLAQTNYTENNEEYFYGLRMTKQSGWDISLFSQSMVKKSDFLSSQNYPDTDTTDMSNRPYVVTVKTENGAVSVWINGISVLSSYKNTDYEIAGPKAAVYTNDTDPQISLISWCDTGNYNLLGDLNGDLGVDIKDFVHAAKIKKDIGAEKAVNDYVKAFNDEGAIGVSELKLFVNYLIGRANTLESAGIKLIGPRNGQVTAFASDEVRTLATNYDLTENRAEQFRMLHKDQYHRSVTTLAWKSYENVSEYTVLLGTNQSLTDAVEYTTSKSKLNLINLIPDTTYYWKVLYAETQSNVFSFVTEKTVRTLTVDGVSNTRDMGGYDTTDGYRIKYGMVFRGGKLDNLSAYSKSIILDDLKVKTDLDLRGYEGPSPLGSTVNYFSYSAPYYWNTTRGVNATGDYRTALVNSIRVFANADNYPIYVHCSLGRDRTGTLCMLISGLCGVSKSDIYLDYEMSFLSEIGSTNDNLTTNKMVSQNFTDLYNGIQSYAPGDTFADACEAFMLSIGITQSEINSIRSIIKESK